MSGIEQAQATAPTPTCVVQAEQRFFLDGISWQFYQAFLDEIGDRPGIRLTFDRGRLELMSPSPEHEAYAHVLGRIFEALADELDLPYKCLRCVTCKREDIERGLEPDNCFYTRNVQAILGLRRFDLTRDPPPDVAIEVDVTRSSLNRLSIYAALGVPEIWRFDGQTLQIYRLRSEGDYESIDRSPTFPFLPLADVPLLVHESFGADDLTFKRTLRAWARQQVAASRTTPPPSP